MSQQINLYDASLCRPREHLSATRLAAAALVLGGLIAAWGGWAHWRLAELEAEAAGLAPAVKSLQDEMTAIGKQRAAESGSNRIDSALTAGQADLAALREVAELLRQNAVESGASFAEYLRALSRQTPAGLWLTGFAINAGERELEIKGRMKDPALLPEFIGRLTTEAAFSGRSFAALQVNAAKSMVLTAGAAANPPAATVATVEFHEFTLAPTGSKARAARP